MTSLEGELVCSERSPKEHLLIEVRDTGGHELGNKICAFLNGKGYIETSGPGVEAERQQREREAREAQEKKRHKRAKKKLNKKRRASRQHT